MPALVHGVFAAYRLPRAAVAPLAAALGADAAAAVDFLMSFHHALPAAGASRRTPLSSALTIAGGYFVGGFVPLSPYWFVARGDVLRGLYWSMAVMAVCLFVFGVARHVAVGDGGRGWAGRARGGLEMVAVGGLAAGASWGIVKGLGHGES